MTTTKKRSKNHRKHFLSFFSARKIIRKLKIKSQIAWYEYSLSKRPFNIPSRPCHIYNEWKGWNDWLGLNKERGQNGRRYTINENYFKKWSPNMAYILGLWWTDGNIFENRFNISQHKTDKYLLENILEEMDSNYPVHQGKDSCSYINIYSKYIVEDIKKLGGCENKSKTIGIPNVPIKYLPSFIGGLWDGDGSIWLWKNKSVYLSSICSGSKLFIYSLHNLLKKIIPDLGGFIKCDRRLKGFKVLGSPIKHNSVTYSLQLGINDTKRIGQFILSGKNKIRLKRKYEKFKMVSNPKK